MVSVANVTSSAVSAAPAAANKAETQAFLELIKNKPPANLDGLLGFINDLRRERPSVYTDREMQAMQACTSGQLLADAIRKCEGFRQQVKKHVDDGRNRGTGALPTAKTIDGSGSGRTANAPTGNRSAGSQAELQRQRGALQQATLKYLDCLSYHVCPSRWGSYTSCWTSLGNLTSAEASALLQSGGAGWEVLCQKERKDLERCVGHHVSSTVRRAVELQDFDDPEADPASADDSYHQIQ
jgi:hypothetical protein